jgi:predicted O-methyltransferase YrrM
LGVEEKTQAPGRARGPHPSTADAEQSLGCPTVVDQSRRTFATELYTISREHDQAHPDRLERFRNVEPPTAELLGVLIRASGARRILELGTSNGYSTIWLADAAQVIGGTVVSVDIDSERTELARGNLHAVGLDGLVELQTEDAERTLARAHDHEWDFVFLDAERPAYPGYLPDLLRTLAPRGVLAVDNVISHEHELVEFTSLIEARPELTQTVVPVGAGLRLAVLTS